MSGLTLHAAVRCGADDHQGLEQLCRYITRPALANERVQTNAAGQVVLKLKTPWRDGTTHRVMSPLEFMQRLAALVPRPRLHLIRFGARVTSLREVSGPPLREHGVLAPSFTTSAKLRALVVRQEPEAPAQVAPPAECEAHCAHHRPVRLSWARLLKRVFEIDLAHCPSCGGELKIIAAILDQPVIENILMHLGLQADCGRRSAPARGPAPQEGLAPASASAARRVVHRRVRLPVGRSCTRPDPPDPSPFRWPGAQRRGDRLRLCFSGPRQRSQIERVNP